MRKLELFIVHTPLQLEIINNILKNKNEIEKTDLLLINDIENGFSIELNTEKNIEVLKYNGIFKKLYKRRAEQKAKIKEIKNILHKYNDIKIYIDDVYYPLCNYFYGFWKKNKLKVELINFPEGILNFIESDLTLKNYFNQLLKVVYSRVVTGIPYYFYSSMSGKKYCATIYTLKKNLLSEKEQKKSIEFKLENIKVEKTFKNSVIVGQEGFLNYISEELYIRLVQEQIKLLRTRYSGEIYYKCHHQKINNKIISELKKEKIYLIEEKDPIEFLIEKYKIKNVSTFVSSAIIQLKILCGDDINCISYKMDVIFKYFKVKKNYLKKLTQIYKKLNIEIIYNK